MYKNVVFRQIVFFEGSQSFVENHHATGAANYKKGTRFRLISANLRFSGFLTLLQSAL